MTSDPVAPQATDVTTELYQAVIGPRSQDYYLRQFARFDTRTRARPTWHWPALLTTFNWLVFRKMWSWALGYAVALLGLALGVFGIGKLVFNYSGETAQWAFGLIFLGMSVLSALYGNAVYYRSCIKRIEKAVASSAGIQQARDLLASQASTRRRWFALALLNALFFALLGSLFILVPAFLEREQTQILAARARPAPAPVDVPRRARPAAPPASAAQAPASAPVLAASAPQAAASAPVPPASAAMPPSAAPVATAPVATASKPKPADTAQAAVAPKAAAKPARPASAAATDIASQAKTAPAAVPARAPAPAATASKPKPADKAQAAVAPKAAAKPARPASAAATDAASQARAAPAAVSASAPAPPGTHQAERRFFIQVGAFAHDSNVRKAQATLEAAGLSSFTQPVETRDGRLTRVKLGPFDKRAEATAVAARIKALDLPALLVRL